MTAKRLERISNPITPTSLVFGSTVGTKPFERISNPVTPTLLVMTPPDQLVLEIEFTDGTTATPIEIAKKLIALSMAMDRLDRSLGGEGLDVASLTQDGPNVITVLRAVNDIGATERLTRVRAAVANVVPAGLRLRKVG